MKKNNVEVSLKDFFTEILKLRYYILFFILIFMTISFFVIKNKKDVYEGSIAINSVSSQLYYEINKVAQFREFQFLTKEFLLDTFIEEILDRSEMIEALQEFNFYDKDQFASNKDFLEVLSERSYALKIFLPSEDENDRISNIEEKNSIIVKFSDKDPDKVRKLMKYILFENNNNVKVYVEKLLDEKIQQLESNKNLDIKKLQYKLNFLIEVYERKTEQRTEFLREQSKIARALSIDQNLTTKPLVLLETNNSESDLSSSSSYHLSSSDQPYYLRGYIAIEEELENILNRKSPELYIPEIIDAEMDYNKIVNNDRLEILKSAVQNLIFDDDFAIASFNVSNLKLENKSISKINLLLLNFIISILFSLLGILILILVRKI